MPRGHHHKVKDFNRGVSEVIGTQMYGPSRLKRLCISTHTYNECMFRLTGKTNQSVQTTSEFDRLDYYCSYLCKTTKNARKEAPQPHPFHATIGLIAERNQNK